MSGKPPTKKARRERARALIDSNRIDVPFSYADVAEMNELLDVQFDGYVRRINGDYPTDPRHIHALSRGVWQSFSWNKAISPISEVQNVKRVLRQIVQDIMDEYRSGQEPVCAHCGAFGDTVDHTPAFDLIADEWLAGRCLPAIQSTPCGGSNMLVDPDAEASWIAFHQARVVYLQILCRPCNSSKGKRAKPTRPIGEASCY